MELETVIGLIPESKVSETPPETAYKERYDSLEGSGSSRDLGSLEESSPSEDFSSQDESGISQDFSPVRESSAFERPSSSEESDMPESNQSESSGSMELESSSEDTQKGSSDTGTVTEIPSDSGLSSSDSLDDKRTGSFSPAVGSDSGLDSALDFSSDSDSGFDLDPGASGSSDILEQMDVFSFSEMDPEVISDWQGNLAACRSSLASCVSLLLFGDILLCLLLGCLCTSIFSRFWKVNR